METNAQLDKTISLADLGRFVKAILRHGWIILGIVLLAGAVSAGLSMLAVQPYEAESWLLIRTLDPLTEQVAPNELDSMSALVKSQVVETRVLSNTQIQALLLGPNAGTGHT